MAVTDNPAGIVLPKKMIFQANGILPAGEPAPSWQRSDQGRDLVIRWKGYLQAPGDWRCVNVGSDAPWWHGFGPNYPWVEFTSGPFADNIFYFGHCTSLVSAGDSGQFGDLLARADQGRPSTIGVIVPGDGGWVEFGQVNGWPDDPSLGPYDESGHWFDNLLQQQLVATIDPDHYLWYPTSVPVLGRVLNARQTVENYDTWRALQTPTSHPNRAQLAVCRTHLHALAGWTWSVAHMSNPVAWNDSRRLGWKFQQYSKRAQGQRLVWD